MTTRKNGGRGWSRPWALLAVAIAISLIAAACGGDSGGDTTTTADSPVTTEGGGDDPATTVAGDDDMTTTTAASEEVVIECDTTERSDAPGAMEMWERTGGNAQMVDALVCAWNARNPDRFINLTYIEHTEMVAALARGVATGDVPDLMGLDLIFGPQFSSAGQLQDITDLIGDDPLLETAVEGHIEVATWEDRLYGVPLYADVSALFWNKDLFEAAGLDPETPPTNLNELHDMAAAVNEVADDVYGYYLPGNCAGCNIFTFGPMIWANGGKIEPVEAGDDALVPEDAIRPVLEWARMMHEEGLIDPAAQAETGATFAEVFGSGKVGIMGTGNFNITLVTGAAGIEGQNPDMDFGITLIPGFNTGDAASFAGGDIVVVPEGSDRLDDAVDFMRFILSDEVQVEAYAKLLNMTTRSDMTDNVYFQENPLVQDVAAAIEIGQTPFTLKFFELINSPQGPWLQMLQRVFYSDDDLDTVIADAQEQMEAIINE
ncbi:MAG TPA: extracellular solute-binding protein [Acidimicrobiia bacterium]|nr:extracellular solute-binding protein [Acidimicrobiia bacterium]